MNRIDRYKILVRYIVSNGLASSQKDLGRKMGYNNESAFSQIINEKVSCPKDFSRKLKTIVPDLNLDWLLYGEGEMLASNDSAPQDTPPCGAVPFYGTLPVSAGSADLMSVMSDETPTGWLQLPEVTGALGAFPVVGCSMEPDIRAGDYVVITAVDRWERLDPDKIYLVITHDDRMIKHLETDKDDAGILWCTSPNYRSFAIRKDEIRAIYRVIFHGRLV